MARWPGKAPAGSVTDEMLSAHDWYKTFAALAGASDKVPTDRPMDGVDASKFLLGESKESGRQTLLFFGPDGSLMSSKWRQVKGVFRYCEGIAEPIVEPQFPMFFDLGSDPGERYNLFNTKLDMGWMFGVHSAPSPSTRRVSPNIRTSSRARSSRGIRNLNEAAAMARRVDQDFQFEIVLVVQAVGLERGNDNGTDTKREDDSTEHCVHPVR